MLPSNFKSNQATLREYCDSTTIYFTLGLSKEC